MKILTYKEVLKTNFVSRISDQNQIEGFYEFIDGWKKLFPKGMKISDQSRNKICKEGWGINDLLSLATVSLKPERMKIFKKYIDNFCKYHSDLYHLRIDFHKEAKSNGIDSEFLNEKLLDRLMEIRQNEINGILKYLFIMLKQQWGGSPNGMALRVGYVD